MSPSMFTEIREDLIRSAEGFEVSCRGFQYLTYIEGDHVLRFEKDLGVTASTYFLRDVPSWEPPFAQELIPAEKKDQIRERILDVLRYRGKEFCTDLE